VIRLIVRTLIALAGNAVGLLVAAAVLDKMDIDATSFIVAVIIFTVVLALLQPFIVAQLRRRNSAALGGVALIATFIALVITDLVSDGFSISGVGTWIAATVIVWVASLLAVFILPYLGLRKYLEERRAT
jgi:putative membrane protein